MGIPAHYSLELPERCLHLIENLWPLVDQLTIPGEEHLGGLTTTFLLAMSSPILTLPIERIEAHFGMPFEGYMDDRALDNNLSDEIERVFKCPRMEKSPFFQPNSWKFADMIYKGENLAGHLPYALSEPLNADEAYTRAAKMEVRQWARCLRNSLAHGGILYLNDEGQQIYGGKASQFAFISARYPEGNTRSKPDRIRALSISESAYRDFLSRWVKWLSNTGLSHALAA